MNRLLTQSFLRFTTKNIRFSSSNQRPMMLMNIPRVVYPNIFYTFKNFFSRILINGYFDPTFTMKPFSEGAKQAVTVVSQLIANDQFDDLQGLVTSEAINEIKNNYQYLSSEQKQKLPVDLAEIVFTYPYLIGFLMDDQANNRLVEITMIFHVLKNRQSYQEAMLKNTEGGLPDNWANAMRKIRDNIVVCNYKFLRDMSKNATDDTWIITGLNHWLPSEYEDQPQR